MTSLSLNKNQFTAKERLKSRTLLQQFFKNAQSVQAYPIRLLYWSVAVPTEFPAQFCFIVPKKKVRLAVHRNRIKRLLREAVRLQKNEWYAVLQQQDKQFLIAFQYLSSTEKPLSTLQTLTQQVMQQLFSKIIKEDA